MIDGILVLLLMGVAVWLLWASMSKNFRKFSDTLDVSPPPIRPVDKAYRFTTCWARAHCITPDDCVGCPSYVGEK